MNQSSATRQKMRAALLSTTGLCAAGMMLPSLAWAVPVRDHIHSGALVAVGDYSFNFDVNVENVGSGLSGDRVQVVDGAIMTIHDRATAHFDSLAIGRNDDGGTLNVVNGGQVYVMGDVVTAFASNGAGLITVDGAGSLLHIEGDLNLASVGQEDSIFEISNGASVNIVGALTLSSGASGQWGRSIVYVGGRDWGTTKTAGQLNVDDINLSAQNGLIFNHAGRSEYAGEISGSGYISAMKGHVVLSGDSSDYEGVIYSHYQEGTIEVNGTLGGTFYLGHGNLTGTGTVKNVLLSPALAGTIRPQDTTPTIGELTIGEATVLYVTVDPVTGKSGTLRVAGKATIGIDAELYHIEGSNHDFRRTASFVIIDAAGGLEGRFDRVSSDYAFLDVSMDYTATQAIMNLTRNDIRFVDVAETPNQLAVAGAIEGISDNLSLSDLVIDLNDEDARLSFTQMAGELHASARSAMLLDASNLRQTVIGSVAGKDATAQGYGAWGRVLSSASKLDGQGENAALKADATGFVAGIDKAFGDAIRAGVLVGFESAEMKSMGLGQIDRDTQHLGVYGRGDWGRLNVQAGAIASWHSLSSERDLAFGNVAQRLKGDYDATSQQAYVEVAYSVPMAWATVSPYASLAFNAMDVDAVSETGGVAALDIAENSQDLTTTGLGIAADKRWTLSSGRAASISARVGWESYSGDLEAMQTVAFADSPDFDIVGLPMGDEAVVASVSVAVPVGKAGQVALDWNGANGSEHERNSVALSYRLSF